MIRKILLALAEQDVSEAEQELQQKTKEDIQRETAFKWAARCIAAWRLGKKDDADDYYHEAIEHAALVEDDCITLKAVRDFMKSKNGFADD